MSNESERRFDAIVVGAGFGGLYALHRLRELGFSVRVFDRAPEIGGTWYWNSYPGARCDIQAVEYSYSFSRELEQEWDWTETMPTQGDIERYLNRVADRFDLRRDIQLGTTVVAVTFDEASAEWTVETDTGDRYVAHFVIAATGCLSVPFVPDFEGRDEFEGATLHTGDYPRDGFDFTGKRVAVIGTGSSGVQCTPVLAEQAAELSVLQRSAAFTRPARVRPIDPVEMQKFKAEYPDLRRRQRHARGGTLLLGALSLEGDISDNILDATMEERLRKVDEFGWEAPYMWADIMTDPEADRQAVELYSLLVHRVVHDQQTADALIPTHPLGCKRPILDTGYYEAFNRDNVRLVDLRKNPIERITSTGIQTRDDHIDLDVIVFATGFDAMTGALTRMNIRGRGGVALQDAWAHGPAMLFGIQTAGFPNLFTITGPGSPSVQVNMVMAIEHHVDWIADCLVHLRDHGYRTVEPTEEAQARWVEEVASHANGTARAWEGCNSWYLGSNVPGKPRVYMAYTGPFPEYREACAAAAEQGYEGFVLS